MLPLCVPDCTDQCLWLFTDRPDPCLDVSFVIVDVRCTRLCVQIKAHIRPYEYSVVSSRQTGSCLTPRFYLFHIRVSLYKKAFSETALRAALDALDAGTYGAVLRCKGVVAGDDGQWIHFDYVPEEKNVRRGPAAVTGRLCVIGANLDEAGLRTLFGL